MGSGRRREKQLKFMAAVIAHLAGQGVIWIAPYDADDLEAALDLGLLRIGCAKRSVASYQLPPALQD